MSSIGDEPGEVSALAPVSLGTGRTPVEVACAKCFGRGGNGFVSGFGVIDSLGDGPAKWATTYCLCSCRNGAYGRS